MPKEIERMNELLQIIGSVASILGVPLAVYLYLKGQVQKYSDVRREIVKRLSHGNPPIFNAS
ncbi:hypothetical protein T35B1_18763 [Salinisphaera shabanensis T35B1]|jgi:hypothetical protein